MKVAIIDLGTNTFNLLVVEILNNNTFQILCKEEVGVKLGEKGIQKKIIAPVPFSRGIETFKKHINTARSYNAEYILAFATSAIRSAENGKEFVKNAFVETGINISIIDGKREAELIYKGVILALESTPDKNHLIMDIGGGSTEFILFNMNGIIWKKSFDLGVARLINKFTPDDPISDKNIANITNYLNTELETLYISTSKHEIFSLIGCSGSFESFANIIHHYFEPKQNPFLKNFYTFDLSAFKKLNELLLKSTYNERLLIKGLAAMRADSIVLASIFVSFIINKLRLQTLQLSHFALKEGVLNELMEKFYNEQNSLSRK